MFHSLKEENKPRSHVTSPFGAISVHHICLLTANTHNANVLLDNDQLYLSAS